MFNFLELETGQDMKRMPSEKMRTNLKEHSSHGIPANYLKTPQKGQYFDD